MPMSRTFPHMSGRHLAGAGPSGRLPMWTPACGLSRCWASSQHGSLVPRERLNKAEWKHMHFYYLVLWSQSITSAVQGSHGCSNSRGRNTELTTRWEDSHGCAIKKMTSRKGIHIYSDNRECDVLSIGGHR